MVLVNQTAIAALPAALSQANSAALRYLLALALPSRQQQRQPGGAEGGGQQGPLRSLQVQARGGAVANVGGGAAGAAGRVGVDGGGTTVQAAPPPVDQLEVRDLLLH